MTDALKHLHPYIPFATIGDDTIMAFTTLADIFKTSFKSLQRHIHNLKVTPTKSAENKRPAERIRPVPHSPAKHVYHTR
jgi:hypothetical protein